MALVNDSENKSISTCTVQRGLKGLGLSSWIALRKPLASETNWRKGFQCEIQLWSNRKRLCDLITPDLACSRVMGTLR